MQIDQTRLRNEIKKFINFNTIRNTLSVDFDSMCIHILNNYHRNFSPADLERACNDELKKLEGLPVCPAMFEEIARYIDEMTIFMHHKGLELANERDHKRNERFQEYRESLTKNKK